MNDAEYTALMRILNMLFVGPGMIKSSTRENNKFLSLGLTFAGAYVVYYNANQILNDVYRSK